MTLKGLNLQDDHPVMLAFLRRRTGAGPNPSAVRLFLPGFFEGFTHGLIG